MSGCPRCAAAVDPRIAAHSQDVSPAVAQLMAEDDPAWPANGLCPACVLHYARCLADQRSDAPLNTATDPHTTFPFYHPLEETVLSQPMRLPDYDVFDGGGVTIAFLDSGFFPHPDLLESDAWPEPVPAWERLDAPALRALLEHRPSRLIHYVDLTDGVSREGRRLPSLWEPSGASWHGQMTSVIAAGNGLLSGGAWRGYAPKANVLPIKIGRSDGRIPEADILAGLRWLLRDDNWRRYGVRVVNISVGGDYPQVWQESELSLAAEALSARGVLIAAAAGNSGRPELLPPAQAPSVLTVGGYDDANRLWSLLDPDGAAQLIRYPHNYGSVVADERIETKPEILGLARFVPSPILPGTPTFREAHAIGRLRCTLSGADDARAKELLAHWQRAMHADDPRHPLREALAQFAARFADETEQSLHEIWHALRKRMNAHKWVHDYYQHVDGTSVAVAQVSAVAAQIFQANPRLDGRQVRALLQATALEIPHWPPEQRGAGIVLPTAAVAAALRTQGAIGSHLPRSGTLCAESRLRKWIFQGNVPRAAVRRTGSGRSRFAYFVHYAPQAQSVSLTGSFNGWTPGILPLERDARGWWHAAIDLPPGDYPYRFWIADAQYPQERWRVDPENPLRAESGYRAPHSAIRVD